MKKYLSVAFLPLMMSLTILPAFSQEKTASFLPIFGYLKNSDNQPSVGEKICVRSGWNPNSAIKCTVSQSDGSFSLNASRAENNYYSFFSISVNKNPNEWLSRDVSELQITNLQSSSNLTESEIRLGLKFSNPNKTNIDIDKKLKNGKVELCRIDNPRLCDVISLAFLDNPEGRYKLVTPSFAYSISVKLWSDREWIEWIAIDKNNKQTESLQIEFGTDYKLVQIKVGIKESGHEKDVS